MIRSLLVVCLLGSLSCKGKEEPAHDHAPVPAKAGPEVPSLSATVYQSGLELFMEYPAFIAGKPSPLVAHFTDARNPNGFQPVTTGRVTAVLRMPDGQEERFVAEKPLRDGIFKPLVTPKKAGDGTLTLVLEGEQASGTVDVGRVTVHPSVEAAIASASVEKEGGEPTVPFFKEQQWKTRYATVPASERVLEGGVRANGEIKAVAGQLAELSAPAASRVPVGGPVPHLGQPVKKGQLLLALSPTTVVSDTSLSALELELTRARAEQGLSQRELGRAQGLFAGKAIPEKQLDTARTAHEVAAARVQAAERQIGLYRAAQAGAVKGLGRAAFELRSPLDGVISFADITPGAVVEGGARLLAVVNTDRVWLEAHVYESDAPRVSRSTGATFTVAGFDDELTVDEKTGRRVAVGAVIDRATRTVPIIYELANAEGRLKPGMFAKVKVLTGETIRGLAVPESAVVDDNGRPVVFVLATGETYHKRVVRPGVRSGGFVQIVDGLEPGDRVVSQGAYEIKLSTATGAIPEHGHQH